MMTYQTRIPNLTQVRGTHYTPGTNHLYYTANNSVFYLPVTPSTILVERTQTINVGGTLNLNGFLPSNDLKWTGTQLQVSNGRISPLSSAPSSLDQIPASTLTAVNWATAPTSIGETGQSPTGAFYAIRLSYSGDFHYVKLRVYQANNRTYFEWVTFTLSPNPVAVVNGLPDDVRDLVISENETMLYFSATVDEGNGLEGGVYVSPRVNTTTTPYPEFSSLAQRVNTEPLEDPQQFAVEEGFIYIMAAQGLWRISPDSGDKELIVDCGNKGGTGLLLAPTDTGVNAYISDDSGKIYVVDISEFSGAAPMLPSEPAYSLESSCGFMTWANDVRSALYVTLPAVNKIVRIDLTTRTTAVEATLPTAVSAAWSVEVISDNRLYAAGDSELGELARAIAATNVLMLGIGLIPFDYINNSINFNTSQLGIDDGKANTSTAPGYYFSTYPNLPFGGELSLMINHAQAWNSNIRFYTISLMTLRTGITRSITDSFVDLKWDSGANKFLPETLTASGGYYAIRKPDELWYNAFLGGKIRTAVAQNGHNVLTVRFYDANKQLVTNGTFTRLLLIDNTRCNVNLQLPRKGTATAAPAAGVYPTLTCGCLGYDSKDDRLEVDFKAWQDQGSGTYALRFYLGGRLIGNLNTNGTVDTVPTLHVKNTASSNKPLRVGHILGDCDIGNVRITLSSPSRIIDGFAWVNLGSSTEKLFTLVRAPVTHTPWTEPA